MKAGTTRAALFVGALLVTIVWWPEPAPSQPVPAGKGLDDAKQATIAVRIENDSFDTPYSGVVIGQINALRYAVTILNVCALPEKRPLNLRVWEPGSKWPEMVIPAVVLNFRPETGLTLLAFVGRTTRAVPHLKMADILDPAKSLAVISSAVSEQKEVRVVPPESVTIAEDNFGLLGAVLTDAKFQGPGLTGSPVFVGDRLAGLVAAYPVPAGRSCDFAWKDRAYLVPIGHAIDIVSHFVGRSAIVQELVDTVATTVNEMGGRIQRLESGREQDLADVALEPAVNPQRRTQAISRLLELYRQRNDNNKLLDLASRLLVQSNDEIAGAGMQIVTGLSFTAAVGNVVQTIILNPDATEPTREQLLQYYATVVNTPPCDSGGLQWFEDVRGRVDTLPLTDRLKTQIAKVRKGPLCPGRLGPGVGR
jgi:hypothetical protein